MRFRNNVIRILDSQPPQKLNGAKDSQPQLRRTLIPVRIEPEFRMKGRIMSKKIVLCVVTFVGLMTLGVGGESTSAEAADWMFAPSYYSHADSPGNVAGIAPASRSAYRTPFVGAHPKFAIRGGYRFNNYFL